VGQKIDQEISPALDHEMGKSGLCSLLNRIVSLDWGLGPMGKPVPTAKGKERVGATGAPPPLPSHGKSKTPPRNIRQTPMTFKVVFVLLLAFTGYQWFGAGLIAFKAWLAPILIEHAWETDRKTDGKTGGKTNGEADIADGPMGVPTKPWPWADTYPSAKLTLLKPDGLYMQETASRYVLNGTDMAALAFGPVRLEGEGADILFGHRETHFRILKDIEKDDHLRLMARDGQSQTYVVKDIWVAHMNEMYAPTLSASIGDGDVGAKSDRGLMLVTCYPFDGITAPDQRFVVWAEPIG
jgi:sortase A